jgi:hypothetical protein
MGFACYGGVVRGKKLHSECMTEEETHVTWARFYSPQTPPELTDQCDRCGEYLLDPPGQPPDSMA